MASDRKNDMIVIDRREWSDTRVMIREVYGFIFGNPDQRYDKGADEIPLYYMMPKIQHNLETIAQEFERMREDNEQRDKRAEDTERKASDNTRQINVLWRVVIALGFLFVICAIAYVLILLG